MSAVVHSSCIFVITYAIVCCIQYGGTIVGGEASCAHVVAQNGEGK